MSDGVYNMSLRSIKVTISTLLIDGDAGEGGFLKVSKVEDSFKTKKGASGSITRSATLDPEWLAELTLTQSSPFNGLLQALANEDEAAARDGLPGQGVSVFSVVDLSGRMLISSPKSWLKKPADDEMTNDSMDKTWQIVFVINGGASIMALGT